MSANDLALFVTMPFVGTRMTKYELRRSMTSALAGLKYCNVNSGA